MINQLNEVVLQLRQEFDGLKASFQREIARLETLVENRSGTFDPEEKPPHY